MGTQPSSAPKIPPIKQSVLVSAMNWTKIWSGLAPSALRMPISLTR